VAADELVEFAWKPLHLLALPGVKGIAAGIQRQACRDW
jgi:hypothetical protein